MKRNVLVVKKCDDCGNLTKFQNIYRTDINDQSLSNMKVKWKRYEYIGTLIQFANSVKRIELREDENFLIDFMRKFEAEIYKYTKRFHRS